MDHTKRLEICELCTNKGFSSKFGVICTLTTQQPAFEETCNDFSLDPQMISKKRRLEEGYDRMSENSGAVVEEVGSGSPVRVIIAIVATILLVMRLLIRCDSINN